VRGWGVAGATDRLFVWSAATTRHLDEEVVGEEVFFGRICCIGPCRGTAKSALAGATARFVTLAEELLIRVAADLSDRSIDGSLDVGRPSCATGGRATWPRARVCH